ncbi:MAG: hypothetical protein K0T01_2275 [Acidimicrobiia bacterium]|nr:hypothetical protein [Acidimicrobiia bacterium]
MSADRPRKGQQWRARERNDAQVRRQASGRPHNLDPQSNPCRWAETKARLQETKLRRDLNAEPCSAFRGEVGVAFQDGLVIDQSYMAPRMGLGPCGRKPVEVQILSPALDQPTANPTTIIVTMARPIQKNNHLFSRQFSHQSLSGCFSRRRSSYGLRSF